MPSSTRAWRRHMLPPLRFRFIHAPRPFVRHCLHAAAPDIDYCLFDIAIPPLMPFHYAMPILPAFDYSLFSMPLSFSLSLSLSPFARHAIFA